MWCFFLEQFGEPSALGESESIVGKGKAEISAAVDWDKREGFFGLCPVEESQLIREEESGEELMETHGRTKRWEVGDVKGTR